jgi:hypothetical protein
MRFIEQDERRGSDPQASIRRFCARPRPTGQAERARLLTVPRGKRQLGIDRANWTRSSESATSGATVRRGDVSRVAKLLDGGQPHRVRVTEIADDVLPLDAAESAGLSTSASRPAALTIAAPAPCLVPACRHTSDTNACSPGGQRAIQIASSDGHVGDLLRRAGSDTCPPASPLSPGR